jgi:VanZ family protein
VPKPLSKRKLLLKTQGALFLLISFLVFLDAAGDEYHQALTPGRLSSGKVVFIDVCGVFTVLVILDV